MIHYLLDTNICVHFMRLKFGVAECIEKIGWEQCCISEITVAELLYGAERSNNPAKNRLLVEQFCQDIEIIPITTCLKVFAQNKAILCEQGTPIEDLDLLIGSTASANGLIMVTENVKHLQRIPNIRIENWVKRN